MAGLLVAALNSPWFRAYKAAYLAERAAEITARQCAAAGAALGGAPDGAHRCTKRLGSRRCRNWRAPGADRCWRHPRG